MIILRQSWSERVPAEVGCPKFFPYLVVRIPYPLRTNFGGNRSTNGRVAIAEVSSAGFPGFWDWDQLSVDYISRSLRDWWLRRVQDASQTLPMSPDSFLMVRNSVR